MEESFVSAATNQLHKITLGELFLGHYVIFAPVVPQIYIKTLWANYCRNIFAGGGTDKFKVKVFPLPVFLRKGGFTKRLGFSGIFWYIFGRRTQDSFYFQICGVAFASRKKVAFPVDPVSRNSILKIAACKDRVLTMVFPK